MADEDNHTDAAVVAPALDPVAAAAAVDAVARASKRVVGPAAPRSVLQGAFAVLRALPGARGAHQVRDVAAVTGLPRATVHRLLGQLRAVDAVERVGTQWALAPSLLRLARRVEPTPGLRRDSLGPMRALREQTGATVSLVVPSERSHVAVEVVAGRQQLPVEIFAGRHLPPNAAGALVLDPLPGAVRHDRGRRAAVDREDTIAGLNCYAAAISLADGTQVALQASTTAARDPLELAVLIHAAAERIFAATSNRRLGLEGECRSGRRTE